MLCYAKLCTSKQTFLWKDQEIKEHEASFDAHVTRDFIDAYLHKIRETTDPKSSFYGELGHLNMRNSMFDLFIAGMDTTATTLRSIQISLSLQWQDKESFSLP